MEKSLKKNGSAPSIRRRPTELPFPCLFKADLRFYKTDKSKVERAALYWMAVAVLVSAEPVPELDCTVPVMPAKCSASAELVHCHNAHSHTLLRLCVCSDHRLST